MNELRVMKLQLLLKGVKQAEIARRAQVSRSAISQVLSGKVKPSDAVRKAFQEVGIEVEPDNGEK